MATPELVTFDLELRVDAKSFVNFYKSLADVFSRQLLHFVLLVNDYRDTPLPKRREKEDAVFKYHLAPNASESVSRFIDVSILAKVTSSLSPL